MPKVFRKKDGDSFEAMMRRFKRAVDKDDIIKTVREREFYVKPSEKRKRAKAAAKKRWERQLQEQQLVVNSWQRNIK